MKMSRKHRIGNIMQAFVNIIESIIIFLSFSYIMPNFVMKFIIWRLNSKYYG